MMDRCPSGEFGRRVSLRRVGDEADGGDPFMGHLMGDRGRRQIAVDRLAAGHGDGIVIKDLEGHGRAGGDGLAHGQTARMDIGAVAEIDKAMGLVREAGNRRPGHAFAAHLGEGLGVAVHPDRHVMAADAGHGPGALWHAGRDVVRAAGAEMRPAGDRRGVFRDPGLGLRDPGETLPDRGSEPLRKIETEQARGDGLGERLDAQSRRGG